MTARVSMLLKSSASLILFWACFFPGRAKDLPAPRWSTKTLSLLLAKVHGKIFRFRHTSPGYVSIHEFQFAAGLFDTAHKFRYINTLRNIYVLFIDSGERQYCIRYTNVLLFFWNHRQVIWHEMSGFMMRSSYNDHGYDERDTLYLTEPDVKTVPSNN